MCVCVYVCVYACVCVKSPQSIDLSAHDAYPYLYDTVPGVYIFNGTVPSINKMSTISYSKELHSTIKTPIDTVNIIYEVIKIQRIVCTNKVSNLGILSDP